MARLNAASARAAWHEMRDQFAAIAQLRWRIFFNSARTLRGRLEMVSWGLMGFGFAAIGLGGMFGLAIAGWVFVSRNETEWLAALFWGIFLYWQLFPVMATAFAESFDSTNFLRFPLRYRSYFFIRMAYGALDPATFVASLWLLGLAAGIGIAKPLMLPWAMLVLTAFAAFNILLNRAIFAWIERWLARRKSREILGIVFFLAIIGIQFIGPLINHLNRSGHHDISPYAAFLIPGERLFPPGLAGAALARWTQGNVAIALAAFAGLCLYAAVCLWVLDLRLRAQFHGESTSESPAPATSREKYCPARLGWNLPGFSGPVAAVFEKEFRYLSRSSPMIFTLLMPIVILLIFRLGGVAGAGGNAHPSRHHHPLPSGLLHYAFPIGVAYALLILTNLIYNSLGADGAGVQMYYVVPVRFRDVLLGKNLVHATILAFETMLLWIASTWMFGPAPLGIVLATLVGLVFAATVNFGVGDCLSLLSPKKMDFAVFGRQRASGTTAFAALAAQLVVSGLVAATFVMAHFFGGLWVAVIINLVLAALALVGYAILLGRIDNLARARRETVLTELLRA